MGDLQRLIRIDWSRRCRSSYFCFQCAAPFCAHCCPAGDDHRRLHHGCAGLDPAQLDNICRVPAVRSKDSIGCGFKTTGIQRFRKEGIPWIPVLPQGHADLRLKGRCLYCDQRTKKKKEICSMSCRGHRMNGGGINIMKRLVHFAQTYAEPSIQLNRFCRVCFRAYNSECCPDHLVHHGAHHHEAVAVAGDVVIEIENIQGWPAISGAGLPAAFMDQVQEIHLDNGDVFYPVHSRTMEQIAHLPQDPEAHPCHGRNCQEIFKGDMHFCSLRCRHVT